MTRGNNERLERLERIVGEPTSDEQAPVLERLNQLHGGMTTLETSLNDLSGVTEERFKDMRDDLNHEFLGKLRSLREDLECELMILKKLVAAQSSGGDGRSEGKVQKPQPFDGGRDAKLLQNFIWDMEEYFAAARIPEEERVSITSTYLRGDAKLWWRTRVKGDLSAGRPKIDSWKALKEELTDQFLPCNVSWVAREALNNLKHTGTTREYVREFASLMLDIEDMSEVDKLFNFLAGLQPWAQRELRRQGVRDLNSAFAAAEALVDFQMGGASEQAGKHMYEEKGSRRENNNGKRNGKPKPKWSNGDGQASGAKGSPSNGPRKDSRSPLGCFICNGPHRAKECPMKESLNAVVVQEDAVQPRIAPLQLLNALQVRNENDEKVGRISTLRVVTGRKEDETLGQVVVIDKAGAVEMPRVVRSVRDDGISVRPSEEEDHPIAKLPITQPLVRRGSRRSSRKRTKRRNARKMPGVPDISREIQEGRGIAEKAPLASREQRMLEVGVPGSSGMTRRAESSVHGRDSVSADATQKPTTQIFEDTQRASRGCVSTRTSTLSGRGGLSQCRDGDPSSVPLKQGCLSKSPGRNARTTEGDGIAQARWIEERSGVGSRTSKAGTKRDVTSNKDPKKEGLWARLVGKARANTSQVPCATEHSQVGSLTTLAGGLARDVGTERDVLMKVRGHGGLSYSSCGEA